MSLPTKENIKVNAAEVKFADLNGISEKKAGILQLKRQLAAARERTQELNNLYATMTDNGKPPNNRRDVEKMKADTPHVRGHSYGNGAHAKAKHHSPSHGNGGHAKAKHHGHRDHGHSYGNGDHAKAKHHGHRDHGRSHGNGGHAKAKHHGRSHGNGGHAKAKHHGRSHGNGGHGGHAKATHRGHRDHGHCDHGHCDHDHSDSSGTSADESCCALMRNNKDSWRFIIMFFLTGGFFLMELIVGIIAQSIALQADAMHMLSDALALAVGFGASLMGTKARTLKHTYGFIRMEIIGALVNATYLLAICISITFEAVERFRKLEEVCTHLSKNVNLVMIVGIVGLVINIVGLFIFCGAATHGHSHAVGGDHGHGHGGGGDKSDDHHGHQHGEHGCDDSDCHGHDKEIEPSPPCCCCLKNGGNLNIMGVFLHVAGDALGSVVVIIATLVIRFGPQDEPIRCATDPIGSLIIVVIILVGAIPLLVRCIGILLHTTPKNVKLDVLVADIKDISDVLDVQELHCWQLNGSTTVVTMHVMLYEGCNWAVIYDDIKLMLDEIGIDSSSVQPKFLPRV